MWSRLRLDIGWSDLFYGWRAACLSGDREVVQRQLEAEWGAGDALACLSVRSAFDLLLRALRLPTGSDVLFSAITIPDMPRIAEAHGLVPVPVDLDRRFRIDPEALRRAWTPQSRMLVAAHLFGDRGNLDEVLHLARERNLLVIEDCAQAWGGLAWRGRLETDASLFSFGPIKTATALGGALCRVSNPELLACMREIQDRDPVQPNSSQCGRLIKSAGLKLLSGRFAFPLFLACGRRFGKSPDELMVGLARGFTSGELIPQIRRLPSAALLALLRRRMRSYNVLRVLDRVLHGRRILSRTLGGEEAQVFARDHSFWVFPWVSDRPEELVEFLRRHGFDATRRGRLRIVPPPPGRPELTCRRARDLLEQTVLLPCYCEIPDREVDRLIRLLIADQEGGDSDTSINRETAAANASPRRS